jgi:hypothetical protein
MAAANPRTEACDERSAMNVATVALLPAAAALMRADAMRLLVLLRPTIARFAPRAASASAAEFGGFLVGAQNDRNRAFC